MPVKLSPAAIVVMSHKLGKKDCVFSYKDDISKPIIPPVFRSAEIVIAGKRAGKLKVTE